MSLNVNNAPKGGKDFPILEAGGYPARVVGVIDLGMQPQEYNGEAKAPANEVMLTYEFSDEFLKDDDGNDLKDKPRWYSEWFPVKHISAEKAKSTHRMNAIDPKGTAKGDFLKTIGLPVTVTLAVQEGKGVRKGKLSNRVSNVSIIREKEAAKLPALVNPPLVFSLDAPDMKAWERIPNWVQEKIVANLEFAGSKLEALLEGRTSDASEAKEPATAGEGTEDSPF